MPPWKGAKVELERLIARGMPGAGASIEDLETLRGLFAGSLKVARELLAGPETGPEESRPPAELVASARAYFLGEYSKALNILQGAEFSDQRSSLQAHLFRAAAQYAIFHTGGGENRQLLDEVRRHIQACRRLDASFRPDSRAFTPRFIAFFRQGP